MTSFLVIALKSSQLQWKITMRDKLFPFYLKSANLPPICMKLTKLSRLHSHQCEWLLVRWCNTEHRDHRLQSRGNQPGPHSYLKRSRHRLGLLLHRSRGSHNNLSCPSNRFFSWIRGCTSPADLSGTQAWGRFWVHK